MPREDVEPRAYCREHIPRLLDENPGGMNSRAILDALRAQLADWGLDPYAVEFVHVNDTCAAWFDQGHLKLTGRGWWALAGQGD